ncbi:cytokine-like nuclear factor N-PAC isoform X1 [Mercenaria mercenaria]|uniref:cytokine-like nuclear factor N-PAC isoform X1 n=1 Tax=Mercenaria mercenaria TaxID=6596 RepID=UPI00234F67D2|nr:cytokine-like nuclear factor N-PAC isoform X1 [Mercenaria mercenaria]
MASKLQIGDLVWAKMKSFPAWPGKIIEPKPEIKRPKKDKLHHCIYFFGSENYAWLPHEQVYAYIGNKEKFLLRSRLPKGFKEAIEAIEDAIKEMPEEDRLKAEELPSIDEELAQIFSDSASADEKTKLNNSTDSPPSDKPDKPKKKKRPRESTGTGEGNEVSPKKTPKVNKPKASTGGDSTGKKKIKPVKSLTPSEKILKRAKMTAGSSPSSNIFSALSPKKSLSSPKMRDRKLPELKVSESDLSYDPSLGAPGQPLSTASGTQLEDDDLSKTAVKSVIPTPMRIGFLGLGIMGQGMVMNLLRSGHEVTVWNRTAQKCRDFVKAGALKGSSPCEVVQQCDITFCCVADTTAVKDIVFGSQGVLRGIATGKCFVEMSTIDEETVQDVAEAIQARGGVYLEAPVVGSRVPALEGQLTILASGDRKLFDDCFSCFEAIGKKSLYLGSDPGAATRMKLIINMVMGSVVASLSEGMAMAEKVGLDLEDVAEVLSLGSLRCPTVIHKSQAILNQKYDPHFPLQHQQKDLRLALQLGDKVEQPLYIAAAANELYKKARRLGYGESDISAVFRAASN